MFVDTVRFVDSAEVAKIHYEFSEHTEVSFNWFWEGGAYTVPTHRIKDVSSEAEVAEESDPFENGFVQ